MIDQELTGKIHVTFVNDGGHKSFEFSGNHPFDIAVSGDLVIYNEDGYPAHSYAKGIWESVYTSYSLPMKEPR